jgi:hypothetical protein
MPEPTDDRKPKSWVLALAVLGIGCVLVAGLVFGALKLSQLHHQRQEAERLQKAFESVKQGESEPLVMQSKLLTLLANDLDCRQIVRGLDFAMTAIDPIDAKAVARLQKCLFNGVLLHDRNQRSAVGVVVFAYNRPLF